MFTPFSAGTGTNPIITSNYSIRPDGTKNADRIQFNRGSGTSGADTSYITKSLSLGTTMIHPFLSVDPINEIFCPFLTFFTTFEFPDGF